MIRFVQRHRTIAALLYRLGLQGWVSRRVWAELDAVMTAPPERMDEAAERLGGKLYRTDEGYIFTTPKTLTQSDMAGIRESLARLAASPAPRAIVADQTAEYVDARTFRPHRRPLWPAERRRLRTVPHG